MHCGDGVITSVRWFTSDSFILEYRGEQLKPHDISPHYSTVPNGKNKNDFSIILSPVETYHEGIFTCSINVRGKADIMKTIKLEVTEIVRVERGGRVTLPCKYRGDGNITVVKWFKSDSFIVEYRGEQLRPHDIAPHYSTDPNGKDKNDFSIILSPVEIRHEGNFTCWITVRGKVDVVKTIILEVTEVQVVIVERGGSATLPCMYHGDGNIFAVKWSKSHSVMVEYRGEPLKPYISAYDTNVPNGKDKNDFSIIIRPADIHHEGIFTCRINVKGKIDVVRTIKLEVPECSLNNLLQLIKNMGIAFGVVLSLLLLAALILFKLGYLSCPCFFSKSNDVQDCNEFSVIQAEVNV
uniref:Ig-like domain-containing protein n=1 Tax=Eptatretus burgeri TaxID=7764 RepID=A0A8C4QM17_EPTBU